MPSSQPMSLVVSFMAFTRASCRGRSLGDGVSRRLGRGERAGLAVGSNKQIIATPGDSKQASLLGQLPESFQLVVWNEGQPAHPYPGPVGTPIRDGSTEVQCIEPPAPARDHVLYADELPGRCIPVQVLVERPTEHAVDDDGRRRWTVPQPAGPPGRKDGSQCEHRRSRPSPGACAQRS